ncbi:pyridoxamine 5'-phosphate oxidase family protein [uncultured Ferrovibrio sp.]|jgi:PPOX class probable FMN-dependent enzyme|uniref:pyridoxamine 5'-phosphate oxidase family protein n=1 Tax=uncultured Ferrovibrio sp. TaxID=1576913 RepID=UPI00262AC97C|nr:pyridoxamine 5'-phosphate oxidase family protein [uncultured Ferrovibrio sp.]
MSTMTSESDLRQCYGQPSELVQKKILPKLDKHAKAFIALSPFLTLATRGPDGADCSPRGDAPGFVAVIDDHTLLLPDRRGNNLIDSLRNIVHDPSVGLLFLVPGINESLRVNGTAKIVTDPARLAPFAVHGRVPASALEISVREVFFHCGKALIRSDLWNPARHIERSSFPTLGRIIADQISGLEAEQTDAYLQDSYKNRLY